MSIAIEKLNNILEKAKYIKRIPKPGGGYRYIYGEDKSKTKQVKDNKKSEPQTSVSTEQFKNWHKTFGRSIDKYLDQYVKNYGDGTHVKFYNYDDKNQQVHITDNNDKEYTVSLKSPSVHKDIELKYGENMRMKKNLAEAISKNNPNGGKLLSFGIESPATDPNLFVVNQEKLKTVHNILTGKVVKQSLRKSQSQESLSNLLKAKSSIESTLKHPDKPGAGAKERKKLKDPQDKIAAVMKEFKRGTLRSSSGKVVTDRQQAIAIAMSEAGLSKATEYFHTLIKSDKI